jgi:hypothetical protein
LSLFSAFFVLLLEYEGTFLNENASLWMYPDKEVLIKEEPTLTKLHRRFIIPLFASLLALGLFAFQALPALACGGLVAPDGDVRLARATTFVAWHDGIERYMTAFTYQGDVSNVGWIVPLPAVPLKIEEGGAWTLQRLNLETHPELRSPVLFAGAETASSAQVLQRVKIEALNITVLRGSGQAVLDWANSNGFSVNGDTRSHLLMYAKGSPIFMAAKFDTAAARARHQIQGDGAPILITMRTPHLWVPLEVLALDGQQVQADIYLLTDGPVNTTDVGALIGQSPVGSKIPGATGFTVAYQEQMNPTLFHDLSTDRNMGWVWQNSWVTYLNLDAPDSTVTYDLGISPNGVIRLAHFGAPPMAVADNSATRALPSWLPQMPIGTPQVLLGVLLVSAIGSGLFLVFRARGRARLNG